MQLTGSRKIFSGLALSAVVALGCGASFAQQQSGAQGQDAGKARTECSWRGRKGFGGRGALLGGRLAEKLNLTDAQKEQMKQIAERYRESTKALRQSRGDERGGGADIFNGGTFDEAQVRARAQQRAQARVELEVARARMFSEMYNVLTPEQKAQLAALRQEREQKRQEWRARRNATTGQTK